MKIPFCTLGLAVLLLLLIVIVTGCTEPQTLAEPETVGANASQIMEGHQYPISFQEGLSKAEEVLKDEESGPTLTVPVFFAQAKQVDSEGKAEQWIFGLRKDGKNFFVVVQSDRQVLQPYPLDLPEKEITSSSVIDPAMLIEKNRQRFMNEGAREPLILPELELSEGYYTVTVSTGSGNAVMLFDARTGNPID